MDSADRFHLQALSAEIPELKVDKAPHFLYLWFIDLLLADFGYCAIGTASDEFPFQN